MTDRLLRFILFYFLCLAAEKPALQSRHSLDSSRVQEKDKETGPLWITLALQKQKGFREQQQSRDERRSQREAKLAEKQTRDSVCALCPKFLQISESPFIHHLMQAPLSCAGSSDEPYRQQRMRKQQPFFQTPDTRRAQETRQPPGAI